MAWRNWTTRDDLPVDETMILREYQRAQERRDNTAATSYVRTRINATFAWEGLDYATALLTKALLRPAASHVWTDAQTGQYPLVNDAAANVGDTSMGVDNLSAAANLARGMHFIPDISTSAHPVIHTITSTSGVSTNACTVSFYPALAVAAANNEQLIFLRTTDVRIVPRANGWDVEEDCEGHSEWVTVNQLAAEDVNPVWAVSGVVTASHLGDGLSGVTVSGGPFDNATTDGGGRYTIYVTDGWNGTLTYSKTGYSNATATPGPVYSPTTADKAMDVLRYSVTVGVEIRQGGGYFPYQGLLVTGFDSDIVTDANGVARQTNVPYGWLSTLRVPLAVVVRYSNGTSQTFRCSDADGAYIISGLTGNVTWSVRYDY